jgi:hypothetical protein
MTHLDITSECYYHSRERYNELLIHCGVGKMLTPGLYMTSGSSDKMWADNKTLIAYSLLVLILLYEGYDILEEPLLGEK